MVKPFRLYGPRQLGEIPELKRLSPDFRFGMQVVAQVLPCRVNQHVIDELIDWDNVPDDPMFQLAFPQPGMLTTAHFNTIADLLRSKADRAALKSAAHAIQRQLNPHPADQLTMNVPRLDGQPLPGLQHKYRETVLFFPAPGQSCFSYCTFCFRWAQFVGDRELKIAAREGRELCDYLRASLRVTDLLVTGGDPLIMRARLLRSYLSPLLDPEFDHVTTIRIGTKALTYWPHRFLSDPDAPELLALFRDIVARGKHLAIMAHFNHDRELMPAATREAIARLQETGAIIRSQSPLLARINDDPGVWSSMWRSQVQLGIIPYYMFVVRDTGARHYFEVPLARAWEVYQQAVQAVSGLARTVRGPSMSCGPGKVEIQGVTEVGADKLFVLRFIQARQPDWVQRPFFAAFDPRATWFDQLKPAGGAAQFFFQEEYDRLRSSCPLITRQER